jgi:hypothetical protein
MKIVNASPYDNRRLFFGCRKTSILDFPKSEISVFHTKNFI